VRAIVNQIQKEAFISAFMTYYKSPGQNKPFIRMAYGARFEVVELRSSYKVTIKSLIKRFNNLYSVGEFIYLQNFDVKHVYKPPLSDKKQSKAHMLETVKKLWVSKVAFPIKKHIELSANA